jgi:hypothetical protein
MTVTLSDRSGAIVTVSDGAFAASNTTLSVIQRHARAVEQLTAMTDRMRGRKYRWNDVLDVYLNDEFLNRLERQTDALDRKQLGQEPMRNNDNLQATFTGNIAGTLLTAGAPGSGRRLGIGSLIGGAGVTADTVIVGRESGVGLAGTYRVSPSQTVASTAMTADGWFRDIWETGDGVPLKLRAADGSYYGINANNLRGMKDDAFALEQVFGEVADGFYEDLAAALALSPGDDAAANAAIDAAVDAFLDETNWPGTDLPL